mgnify:CR=1 FL=1
MADVNNNELATNETTRLAPYRARFRPLIDFDPPRALEEELFSRWFTANFDLTRSARRTDYVTALNEIDE